MSKKIALGLFLASVAFIGIKAQTVTKTDKTMGFAFSDDNIRATTAVNSKGVGLYSMSFFNQIYRVQNGVNEEFISLDGYSKRIVKKGKKAMERLLCLNDKFYMLAKDVSKDGVCNFFIQQINDDATFGDPLSLFKINNSVLTNNSIFAKISPDNKQLLLYSVDRTEELMKIIVLSSEGNSLSNVSTIKLNDVGQGGFIFSSKYTRIDAEINNQKEVYVLQSNLNAKLIKTGVSYTYCYVNSEGVSSGFKNVSLNCLSVSDVRLMTTKDNIYLSIMHSKEKRKFVTGIQLHVFKKENLEEEFNHEFTPQELYSLANEYSASPSLKTAKNKIWGMQSLRLAMVEDKLVLVTEQFQDYTTQSSTGRSSASVRRPMTLTVFVIKANQLEKIINIPKDDFGIRGKGIGSYVKFEDDKLKVLTHNRDVAPLVLYVYSFKTKRLQIKPIPKDIEGKKIRGIFYFPLSSGAGDFFFGPLATTMMLVEL